MQAHVPLTWHLLAGEYPPAPGGVSDYTQLVAKALVAAGDSVEVWAPACGAEASVDDGVRVHWLPSHFGPGALRMLERALKCRPGPRRLLVQYVPHAFGYKAMNVGLAHWLFRARRRERVWVMFHEVCFSTAGRQPWKHNLLAAVQRWMARQVAAAARRRFVATPRWEQVLLVLGQLAGSTEWLPVPSTVGTEIDPETAATIRARLAPGAGQILGHFGTFAANITDLLTQPLVGALERDPRRIALLVGRGSLDYAGRLRQEYPALAGRITATGGLDTKDLTNHLAACDLLLQPYPDGATARRTSLMASTALGLSILSSRGPFTEPIWESYGAVCLADNATPAWDAAVERLLGEPAARAELGRNAKRVYRDWFCLERTVSVLRARHQEDAAMECVQDGRRGGHA